MPSTRPCAAFEPISPDFDVRALVEATPNFEYVVRIQCDMIDHQGLENFEKLVLIHVIIGGKPLVIEGCEARLDKWTFALQWLRDNCGAKVENARDLTKKTNVPLSIGHYLNNMALLTNQWTTSNYKDPERQRMYLKDIDCPQLWHDKLQNIVPAPLFYLNESTGDIDGFGANDEPDSTGSGMRRGRGIAKAGDLMSSLPKEMRAENLMCYIGHEGTYTPSHREMCASLGQNIMVEASTGSAEDHKPTRPGSSIWFMTESKEREVVAEYWLSRLGHDIEIENHFAQVNAWKNAPFKTYVVEQKPGDFILIPPLAPHQVWNRGTRTMKVAWNRTTVETLEMATNEALPRARMACRDEQYKNKAIIYFTLQKYSKLLRTADKLKQKKLAYKERMPSDVKVRQLQKDFRRLHSLYTQILLSESLSPDKFEKNIELVPFDSNITCSYCRCNIFNRFLTCTSCIGDLGDGEQDTYDVCMECYAMGRSCACISKLKWVEQFPWPELLEKHEQWRQQLLGYESTQKDRVPMSLKIELNRLGQKRTLAQICQIELAKRPWRDVTKPPPTVDGVEREEEVEVDANGNLKKKRKIRRSEKFVREHGRCHIDCHWEPKWKQAQCSTCDKNYCYGNLFRAYDMMPQDIMSNPDWRCPSCQNICGCRHCRPRPGYKPYIPKGTLLGHNTKAVADPRSVESLVDFSYSNLSWIQKAGDDRGDESRRLMKRRKEAAAAKAQDADLSEDYVGQEDNQDDIEERILRLAEHEGIPIDPALAALGLQDNPEGAEDEDVYDENPEGPRFYDNPISRTPLAPQYVVPEGGIFRDTNRAYDSTEAITYDYPDPDVNLIAPVVIEEEPLVTGYGPAAPESPSNIEMVDRKRKRHKLDEGDRPYKFKAAISYKGKKRPSLVVKLPINKAKLAEFNKMAIVAQQALAGILEAPAPKVNSDLQALNTKHPTTEAQPVQKKPRIEHILPGRDDEFTPSRYRDRRKEVAEGETRPLPDSNIKKRQTRMQAVTYEDPSDEEMSDAEEIDPVPVVQSKLATMQQAIDIDDIDDDDNRSAESMEIPESVPAEVVRSQTIQNSISQSSDLPITTPPLPAVDAIPAEELAVNQQSPKPVQISSDLPRQADEPKRKSTTGVTTKAVPERTEAAPRPRSTSTSSTTPDLEASKALAEARANRRAKMAAIEWMEHDSEDLDDAWSAGEQEGVQNKKQPSALKPRQTPFASVSSKRPSRIPASISAVSFPADEPVSSRSSSSSSSPSASPQPIPANERPSIQGDLPVPKVNSTKAAKNTVMKATSSKQTAPMAKSASASAPTTAPTTAPKKIQVSVADWADSDSDDDKMFAQRSFSGRGGGSSGWVPVNGGRGHVSGVVRPATTATAPRPTMVPRGRARGRPPLAGRR